MCYYAQTVYVCKDWKWGNLKERCPRQHRMGESCGVKLVHPDFMDRPDENCRVCKDIDIKKRKYDKETQNIQRWRKEGTKFVASIEKAEKEVQRLIEQMAYLETTRAANKVGLQSRRQDIMHTGSRHNAADAVHHVDQMKDMVDRQAVISGGGRHGQQSNTAVQGSQSSANSRHASLPYRPAEHARSDRHRHG